MSTSSGASTVADPASGAARLVKATKTYERGESVVRALDAVTCAFDAGAFTAVMGPSGSGKTTLLHCVGGIAQLTSGEAWLADRELSRLSDRERAIMRRDQVGFVFQEFNLLPALTARENIVLPLQLARGAIDTPWLDEIVSLLGLGARLDHRPGELSGGEQQRVAVARALVTKPTLIAADEPTGNLDSTASEELLAQLRRSVDELGQTVIMVTHNPVAAAYSDRALFLVDGSIVTDMAAPSAQSVLAEIGRLAT